MAQEQQDKESGPSGFVESLREIQGEYIMLGELYEKQKSYALKLTEMMKTLQFEVDTTISIRPEAMDVQCRAAYLVSEAVVVSYDMNGGMRSRPLYTLPGAAIISIIEECAPELRRLISEKRRMESSNVKSMERVLKELKRAQATFKQAKREEIESEEEEEARDEPGKARQEEVRPLKEQAEAVPQTRAQGRAQRDGFAFRGSYGEKPDVSTIPP